MDNRHPLTHLFWVFYFVFFVFFSTVLYASRQKLLLVAAPPHLRSSHCYHHWHHQLHNRIVWVKVEELELVVLVVMEQEEEGALIVVMEQEEEGPLIRGERKEALIVFVVVLEASKDDY